MALITMIAKIQGFIEESEVLAAGQESLRGKLDYLGLYGLIVEERSDSGLTTILPLLASDIHRPVRRCERLALDGFRRGRSRPKKYWREVIRRDMEPLQLTMDMTLDRKAHPEELGALVDISKSGMITSALGNHYILHNDAKCDTSGALWHILGINSSTQRVFGEAIGFSLLLTTHHGFQSDGEPANQLNLTIYFKVFTYLLRLMTTAVCDNTINRTKLHAVISSQTFYDLLSESGLISVDCERQVVQQLLELDLEIVLPPFMISEGATLPNASDYY
ncbi:hypothetical protein FXO38_23856 [Capsicum annuum]|nr:hypothetical protein FXO38_23856 [Capsicum annuum]